MVGRNFNVVAGSVAVVAKSVTVLGGCVLITPANFPDPVNVLAGVVYVEAFTV